jgi:prepilin-type processing-associated H-X9-DG protein
MIMKKSLTPPAKGVPAFTITELLVILATIALLAATLLPALANTKFRDQFANCTANLRQWGVVASAFSSDNKGRLPSFPIRVGYAGGNLWDVDNVMTTNLVPYGAAVPMYFCPVRDDFQAIVNANPGVAITSPTQFIALNNPAGRQGIEYNHVYLTIFYSVYIPRQLGTSANSGWWPIDTALSSWPKPSFIGLVNPAIPYSSTGNPWPLHSSDKWAAANPIMTDTLFYGNYGGFKSTWAQAAGKQAGGHAYGGQIVNANLLYADGHVVVHNANQFVWSWFDASQYENFY